VELKIGVVNLNKVFDEYIKRKVYDQKLKDLEKHYEKVLNEKKEINKRIREEISLLDMGSGNRIKKEELFQKGLIDLEVFAQFAEQDLLKKYKDYFEAIYIDVSKVTEKFGKENGYDLIVKNEEPEIRSNDVSDLQFKIGIKSILYYSGNVDITSSIIQKINEPFASESKNR